MDTRNIWLWFKFFFQQRLWLQLSEDTRECKSKFKLTNRYSYANVVAINYPDRKKGHLVELAGASCAVG